MASNSPLDVDIEAILYPLFNTVRLDDNTTVDGRPYQEGVNLPGPVRPQYRWDMDNQRNVFAYNIEPCARMIVAKQEQFYEEIFKNSEVFFGGARGGGKTVVLLLSHVLKHLSWMARGITGQTTAMFTETKEELLRRHIVEMKKYYPPWLGYFSNDDYIFYFHPKFGGGKIMFLYIGRKDADTQRLLSYQFAYITVDELTRDTEQSYLFISSCLRSSVVPARELCTSSASNPGSRGHKWVRKRFVDPRSRRMSVERNEGSRVFIQSLPMDNPMLPPEYWEKQLNKLGPKQAKAYRDGDWSVFEGQFFDMLDEEIHIIPRFRVPDNITKFVGIDIGTNHPTGAVWALHYPPTVEHTRGKLVVYRYFEKRDKWPSRVKKEIYQRMKDDKNVMRPIGISHDAFSTRGSSQGDLTIAEMYNSEQHEGQDIIPSMDVISAGRDRKIGLRVLLDLLSFQQEVATDEFGDSYLKLVQPPQLYFMDSPETRMLFDELAGLVHKDGDSEDAESLGANEYDVGDGDEGPDALRHLVVTMGGGVLFQDFTPPAPKRDPMQERRRDRSTSVGYGSFVM